MEYRDIQIVDTGADKYSLQSDNAVLGRQYDNEATSVRIVRPNEEKDTSCFMIVTNEYGVILDHIIMVNDEAPIRQNLSKYSAVKIGFSFVGANGYIKNTAYKRFVFAPALNPSADVEITPEQSASLDEVIANSFVDVRWSEEKENTLVFYNIEGKPTHEFTIDLSIDPNTVVTTDTNQKITGRKDFSLIGVIGEENIPVFEDVEHINNYEYIVDSFDDEEPYYFVLNENGYYQNNNAGIDNTYAVAKVQFEMFAERDLVIEVINNGEDNISFGLVSEIDKDLLHSTDIDSEGVYKSFIQENSENPQIITFENVGVGIHTFTIKQVKLGTTTTGNDSLQFKIVSPVGELVDIVSEVVRYEDYNGTIDLDKSGNLTYNNKQVITEEEFRPVESLAKGANQAESFETYSDFVTAVNSMEKGLWNNGQIFNIVTTKVPDLWIVREVEEKVDFVYVSDADIVNRLETNGTFQVGYYVFGAMESGKVDLSEYPTTSQMNTAIDNAIKTTLNTEV